MTLTLEECYRLLELTPAASDEEIARNFRRLAMQYHPDRNRNRIEWANGAMARINHAYSVVMGARFERNATDARQAEEDLRAKENEERAKEAARAHLREMLRERYIAEFVSIREETKDHLYRYFQYNLDNLIRREEILSRQTYDDIVRRIRYSYHAIATLETKTDDEELLDHFAVFKRMILSFYRSSECLNMLDSYSNIVDVEAYRLYLEGDRHLHLAQKEIFYERHNRGTFRQPEAMENTVRAALFFRTALDSYPASSWAVESGIKLECADALHRYIDLFFNED